MDAKERLEYLELIGKLYALSVRKILSENGYPLDQEFVIAGGFFVDHLLGRPFKDIDVFIPSVSDTLISEDNYGEIVGLKKLHGTPVEVITLATRKPLPYFLWEAIERIDIGLCRIGIASDGVFQYTDGALSDLQNQTLTVYRQNGSLERQEKRIAKLKEKTGWDKVIWKS